MEQPDSQKARPAGAVQLAEVNAAAVQHIRQQGNDGGKQLQNGALDSGDVFNKFVEQNNGGVKHCRAQAEENARQISVFIAAKADNHHQTQRGHNKADNLFGGQPLAEQERRRNGDDNGGKVIAQRRCGNCGVAVRLKQQNPVNAHGDAGG